MLSNIQKQSTHLKLLKILLFSVGIVFLLLFTVLSFHNRFLSDDYQYYDIIRNQGWLKSFSYYYTHQTIRWSALLVFNSLFFLSNSFFRDHLIIFFFHISSMALLVYSVFLLLTNSCRIILQSTPPLFYRLLFSILFAASFYFSTIQIAESWFWVLSGLIHMLNIVFSLLGLAFIIKIKKRTLDYAVIIASFLYVGGAAENYTFFLLLVFAEVLFYLRLNKKQHYGESRKSIFKGITIATVSMLLSFIVNVSGPGIFARLHESRTLMPHANPDKLGELWNFTTNIFVEKKNLTFLLLSSLWIFAGMITKIEGFRLKNEKFKISTIKMIAGMVLCLVTVGLLVILPLYFAFNAIGPERAMAAVSLVVAAIICWLFFFIGLKLPTRSAFIIMLIASTASLSVLSFYTVRQCRITHYYAECYDNRCLYLESLKHVKPTDTIEVKGLPDSGMLPNGDITDDPDHFININFMKALGLNFKVKSSDNYYRMFTSRKKEF